MVLSNASNSQASSLSERQYALVDDDVPVLIVRLEQTLISVDPHQDIEMIAGHHGLGKAGLHRLEPCRIRATNAMQERAARKAIGTQIMKDRTIEAAKLCKGWVGMKWIAVSR